MKRGLFLAAVAVAAALGLGAPAASATDAFSLTADPTTLLDWGATGYRYHQLDDPDAPSDGFEVEGFDDSGWQVGQAPFGNEVECVVTGVTFWNVNTDLLVRREFTVPAGTRLVSVHIKVDNAVKGVYLNGHDISGFVEAGGFCNYDVDPVPAIAGAADTFLHEGTNLLAVRAHDTGGTTHLNLKVTGVVGAAGDVTAPVSSAAAAGCGDDSVSVTVLDEDGGSGPKAVHFKVDGGSEQSTATAADGTAALAVPEGSHEVEYWGEDQAGNLELTPHTLTVLVDRIGPEVTIVSDQGKNAYAAGEIASISVTASDGGSGLDPAHDPTVSGESISTAEPGEQVVTKTARDLCGNETTQEFRYTVAAQRALTVERVGAGTVTGTGIDCGVDCAETYDHGTVVALAQVAAEHWRFVRWEGVACVAEGACPVTMDADRTVTAVFERIRHALTVALAGDGAGRVVSTSHPGTISCLGDCEETYDEGALVTLQATPATHSRFVGWSLAGCGGQATCVVPIAAARTVVARFDTIKRRLTVVIFGSGTVTLPPDGPVCTTTCHKDYTDGDIITITAAPTTGWRLQRWSGACGGQALTCRITMNDAKTATATFEQIAPPRRLTAIVLPERGGRVAGVDPALECSTTCTRTFAHGTVVNLRAEPAAGYRFVRWSGGAPCVGTNPACEVRMDGDRAVTASFERINPPAYRVIPGVWDPGMGRVVDPANAIDCRDYTCGANYPSGTAFALLAEPAAGYRFLEWALGPCQRSTNPRCAFRLSAPSMSPVAKFARGGTPRPTIGRTAVTRVLGGSVSYQPPAPPGSPARSAQADAGEPDVIPFLPLDARKPIPVGSTVDATKGALRLTVQTARGGREKIKLSGGRFVFRQAAKGRQRGRTVLKLTTAGPNPCAASGARTLLQRLKAAGGGAFVVRTRFSESTSRRATWTTEDRCDATKTKVSKGRVIVRDLAKKHGVTLRPRHSHTVRARKRSS